MPKGEGADAHPVRAVRTRDVWWALAVLCCVDLLRAISLYALDWALRHVPRANSPCGNDDVAATIAAVDEACIWYFRRVLCLQRAAALTWLLRRKGASPACVIGVRSVPFEAHAWVELNDRVVGDADAYRTQFARLRALGSEGGTR